MRGSCSVISSFDIVPVQSPPFLCGCCSFKRFCRLFSPMVMLARGPHRERKMFLTVSPLRQHIKYTFTLRSVFIDVGYVKLWWCFVCSLPRPRLACVTTKVAHGGWSSVGDVRMCRVIRPNKCVVNQMKRMDARRIFSNRINNFKIKGKGRIK